MKILCALLIITFCILAPQTYAQEQDDTQAAATEGANTAVVPDNALPADVEVNDDVVPEAAETLKEPAVILSVRDDVDVNDIPSLFFTPEALALLRDAIKGLNAGTGGGGPENPQDPGIRELALGGIVYTAEDDWTIWLNGRRITPNAIPGEIFDLTVQKEYIDIKWYDAYTNRLYPVRLRANERFNLDSRLFLTGAHTDDQQL